MRPTRPNTLTSYVESLRCQSVGHSPRPDSLPFYQFWDEFDAPGGVGEKIPARYRVRYYRVAEISGMDVDTSLPQMIDHHAGKAWKVACHFAAQGFCPRYVPNADSPRSLSDVIARFPEELRNRLDAVLEGLRIDADPDGYYEQAFMDWQRDWYSAMQTAYAMSDSAPKSEKYETRLRLCRRAAEECFPDLEEWFNELRENVCDGGHSRRWGEGDSVLGPSS